ncbi:MAG: hypothetical protein R3F48_08280 [Candidatus Zixiibacteriota bacterium]
MYKFTLSFLSVLLIFCLLVSCGPKTQAPADEMAKRCTPKDLKIEQTGSHLVKIGWNPGCPGTRIMQGFNIYASAEPLVKRYFGREMPDNIKPYNDKVYPGALDASQDREYFDFENIQLGQLYYVHVRVVNSDGSLSLPTNEIEVICFPQGTLDLAVSYSGNEAGFSFVTDTYCGTDDVINDLYFFSKDGKDFLCSPSRISEVNRQNKIYVAGKAASLGGTENIGPVGSPLEKTELIPGTVYIIETEDGHFAKLRLVQMKGSGNERRAEFEYFYRSPVIKLQKGV